MKKLFIAAIMAVATLTANADNTLDEGTFSVKPYLGMSYARVLGTQGGCSARVGGVIGVEGQYMANDWLGISAGLAYSQQGATYKGIMGKDVKLTAKIDYVNMPILANFYVLDGLAVKAGVQPGYAVYKQLELSNTFAETADVSAYAKKSNYNNFDLAIPVGISYEFQNVVIDARYIIGTLDITNNESLIEENNYKNVTNGVWQVTVGYRF